jgi:hypothetical protein
VAAAPRGALSYTALTELERCSYRYYLERILGIGERAGHAGAGTWDEGAPGDDVSGTGLARARTRARTRTHARARGMLVHRLLESAEPEPRDEEIASAAKQLGIATTRAERAEVARLVSRARAPEGLFVRLKAARRVHREHPFAFVLGEGPGETVMTGMIDVLAYEEGARALIVDYKTDRVAAGCDLEELVETEYWAQRAIYALALLRAGAEEVEIAHWFLEREDGCVTARFCSQDREQLERALKARVQSALAAGFTPTAEPHRGLCATCPGRGGLCSYDDAQTLRERPSGRALTGARAGTGEGSDLRVISG